MAAGRAPIVGCARAWATVLAKRSSRCRRQRARGWHGASPWRPVAASTRERSASSWPRALVPRVLGALPSTRGRQSFQLQEHLAHRLSRTVILAQASCSSLRHVPQGSRDDGGPGGSLGRRRGTRGGAARPLRPLDCEFPDETGVTWRKWAGLRPLDCEFPDETGELHPRWRSLRRSSSRRTRNSAASASSAAKRSAQAWSTAARAASSRPYLAQAFRASSTPRSPAAER
jgi:hypothetical protein